MASSRPVGDRPSSVSMAPSSSSVSPSCRCSGSSTIWADPTRRPADSGPAAGPLPNQNALIRRPNDASRSPMHCRWEHRRICEYCCVAKFVFDSQPEGNMASDKTKMSTEHKAALAEGRANGRAVREYLEALEATKPKRGRKRTPESVKKRLDAIGIALALSLIHISEPTRRTPISYAVFC